MVTNITLTKGAYTVTVYAEEVVEDYSNKMFLITPATSKGNQETGPKETKVVDLQRVTHNIVIRGWITSQTSPALTANQVKSNLISIFKGAGINGGVVTLNYDGTAYTGYIEKFTCTLRSADTPEETPEVALGNYSGGDYAKYSIGITFVEGITI